MTAQQAQGTLLYLVLSLLVLVGLLAIAVNLPNITWPNQLTFASLGVSLLLLLGALLWELVKQKGGVYPQVLVAPYKGEKPSPFDIFKSGATNLTLATQVITTLFSTNVLTTRVLPAFANIYSPVEVYIYLQIFFGAVLLVALTVYFADPDLLLFRVAADVLVYWAALGVVATLFFLLLELPAFPRGTFFAFEAILIVSALGICWHRLRGSLRVLKAHQDVREAAQQQRADMRVASLADLGLAGRVADLTWRIP